MVAYLLRLFVCLATTNQPDTPLFFKSAQTPDWVIAHGRILAFEVALFASEKYGISDGYCFRSC
jgi:hypothetical protein